MFRGIYNVAEKRGGMEKYETMHKTRGGLCSGIQSADESGQHTGYGIDYGRFYTCNG